MSRCTHIVAKHDKLDDKRRREAVQLYGDAAMKMLRDATGKGYRDVAHIKSDTDLEPLRRREDFQKLVEELEGGREISRDRPAPAKPTVDRLPGYACIRGGRR